MQGRDYLFLGGHASSPNARRTCAYYLVAQLKLGIS